MKPNRNLNTVTSTMTGEDVRMGLDAGATAHLMGLLTNLYSDRELAILREYSTNALDAHVVAGIDAPIEVELPSNLRPTLVIRDFGPGLSAEDIRTVYSQYGASTKRESNEVTGMLGVGGKAALTYTDQFSVVSVKDGERITVSVSRDEDGGGTMKIVATEQTDDPTGVEIHVPCAHANDFADKAADFFRFWPAGSVLIDGQAPEQIAGIEIVNGPEATIHAFQNSHSTYDYAQRRYVQIEGLDQDYIIQGNVAYPCDERLTNGTVRLAVWVPIGSVDFAPSREALVDTPRTTATIQRLRELYAENVESAVQRRVDKSATKADALRAWADSRFLGSKQAPKFDGQDVPDSFAPASGKLTVVGSRNTMGAGSRYGQGAHQTVASATLEQVADAPLWVTGFDNCNWTSAMRRKLDAFVADRFGDGVTANKAILTPTKTVPRAEWIEKPRVVAWADVRKFKLPSSGGTGTPSGPRIAGTYSTLTGPISGNGYPVRDARQDANTIPQDDSVFWKIGTSHDGLSQARALIHAYGDKAVLVVVPQNRVDKFQRLFPKARPYSEAIREAAAKWWRSLTPRQRSIVLFEPNRDQRTVIDLDLDPAKVDDPELARLTRIGAEAEAARETHVDSLTHYARLRPDGLSYGDLGLDGSPCARYPLLRAFTYAHVDGDQAAELITYVNAKHSQTNNNQEAN